MSIAAKYEYFQAIYHHYHSASKKEKKIILDEFCNNCNYNRKHSIRLLNSPLESKSTTNLSRHGRKKIYDDAIIETVLIDIWGKGEKNVLNAIQDMDSQLPFPLRGL